MYKRGKWIGLIILLTQKELLLLSTSHCQALYETLYPQVYVITAPIFQVETEIMNWKVQVYHLWLPVSVGTET